MNKMKKYVKPDLFYENFELNQSIAVCGWDMSNQAKKENCTALGYEGLGNFPLTLFTDKPRCEATEQEVESYCYEVSSGAMGVFNS